MIILKYNYESWGKRHLPRISMVLIFVILIVESESFTPEQFHVRFELPYLAVPGPPQIPTYEQLLKRLIKDCPGLGS